MCMYCVHTPEERKAVRESADYFAGLFHRMAEYEKGMAQGRIDPHSEEAKSATTIARTIVRHLVEGYGSTAFR